MTTAMSLTELTGRTHTCQARCHNGEQRHCDLAMYAKGPSGRLDLDQQGSLDSQIAF